MPSKKSRHKVDCRNKQIKLIENSTFLFYCQKMIILKIIIMSLIKTPGCKCASNLLQVQNCDAKVGRELPRDPFKTPRLRKYHPIRRDNGDKSQFLSKYLIIFLVESVELSIWKPTCSLSIANNKVSHLPLLKFRVAIRLQRQGSNLTFPQSTTTEVSLRTGVIQYRYLIFWIFSSLECKICPSKVLSCQYHWRTWYITTDLSDTSLHPTTSGFLIIQILTNRPCQIYFLSKTFIFHGQFSKIIFWNYLRDNIW